MRENQNMEEDLTINRNDLPALYLAASNTSSSAQRNYLLLVIANLVLLGIAALLSSFSFTADPARSTIMVAGVIAILTSIIITVIIQLVHPEKDWYGGRAIAESVKSIAWRYITRAKPYENNANVDRKFTNDLDAILKERKFLSGALGGKLSNYPQITEKMRYVRTLSTKQRKEIYIINRIKDQRTWYGNNSEINRKKKDKSFVAIIAAQILALAGVIFVIRYTDLFINPVGFFSTIAASVLAWLQVKQYQELAQSYGLAAQELGMIQEESKSVRNDQELSRFVLNSENAISREHTLWIARKGQT